MSAEQVNVRITDPPLTRAEEYHVFAAMHLQVDLQKPRLLSDGTRGLGALLGGFLLSFR